MIAYTRSRAVRTVFTLLVTAAFLCLPGAIASGQEKQPTTKPDKPVEFKQLQKDFRQAYRAADYPKALASLEKMNEQKPKDIDTLYNLACVTCLLGQKDKTYGWIEKAIEAGYKDWRHLSTDNDLRTIHAEDRFRKIVKELRAAKLELPPEEKPAKPETPKKPEKPEKPEKPAKPETPKKPEKPAEPEKPAKPKEAEKPAKKELSAAERQAKILELTQGIVNASQKKEYEKGLKLALEALDLADVGLTNYNVACMYSGLNKKDEAFKYLDKAIELGGFTSDMVKQMEDDQDLENIRKDPRYAKAIEKAGGKPAKPAEKPEKPEAPKKDEKPAKKEMSEAERAAKVEDLTSQAIAAIEAKKYDEALKLTTEAQKLVDNSLTNYNLACVYSRLEKKDEAFKYLNRAIELKNFPSDIVTQMKSDSDLDNIRKDARYAKALEKAGGKADKAEAKPAEKPEAKPEAKPKAKPEGKEVPFKWKVTVPKGFDKGRKAPLIVALHGKGGNMERATETWSKAAAELGAILLAPQGTYELKEGQFAWAPDVDVVEGHVMDAINKAMDEYKIDEDKVVIVGFDDGARLAAQLGLRNADAFCGMVVVAGEWAWPSGEVDAEDMADFRASLLVGADDKGPLVDANKKMAKKLEELKTKVKLNVYDDLGHDFPKNAVEEQVKALKYVLEK